MFKKQYIALLIIIKNFSLLISSNNISNHLSNNTLLISQNNVSNNSSSNTVSSFNSNINISKEKITFTLILSTFLIYVFNKFQNFTPFMKNGELIIYFVIVNLILIFIIYPCVKIIANISYVLSISFCKFLFDIIYIVIKYSITITLFTMLSVSFYVNYNKNNKKNNKNFKDVLFSEIGLMFFIGITLILITINKIISTFSDFGSFVLIYFCFIIIRSIRKNNNNLFQTILNETRDEIQSAYNILFISGWNYEKIISIILNIIFLTFTYYSFQQMIKAILLIPSTINIIDNWQYIIYTGLTSLVFLLMTESGRNFLKDSLIVLYNNIPIDKNDIYNGFQKMINGFKFIYNSIPIDKNDMYNGVQKMINGFKDLWNILLKMFQYIKNYLS